MLIFWKQIGLFVQIAIVVAAVLLFSFFDPFGFLKSKKLKLENTPINVSSIKEIGEFITAEYYGEVLNSLQQSRINQVIEKGVDMKVQYQEIHDLYQNAIRDLIDDKDMFRVSKWNKKNDLYNYFYQRFNSLTSNPYYQDYMKWLLVQMTEKTEKQLLKYFYNDEDDALRKLSDIDISNIMEIKEFTDDRLNALSSDKKFRKQQIVVLGRGWVKAGIDFGKFTNQNFKYDKETKIIHLIGVKPEILSCTINPWFIPEKQVKGFEVILVSNKANRPKYMQMVKEETLRKLRENALKANIIEKAKINAEENLKDFFSLLIDGGIEDVIIHDDFFNYFDVAMTGDSLNAASMRAIDSLFVRRYESDSMEVVNMRDSLKNHEKVHLHDYQYDVQRFSSLLVLIEDEELSAGELSEIESIRDNILADRQILEDTTIDILYQKLQLTKLDTIWYYPDAKGLKVISDFVNETLKPKKSFTTRQIIFGSEDFKAWEKERLEKIRRKVYIRMLDKKDADYKLIVSQIKDHVTQLVLKDETIMEVNEGVNRDTIIDQRSLLFVHDIRKKVNEELLLANDSSIDLKRYIELKEDLAKDFNSNKPYLIVSKREALKYRFCMSTDCISIGKYTFLLNLDYPDSIDQNELDDLENEIWLTLSDIDSLNKSGVVYHVNRLDSIWYYPSEFTLMEFVIIRDENYPEKKVANFFNKTFNNKSYKKTQEDKQRYFHELIYNFINHQKLEELKNTKSILLRELDFKDKLKIAS